MTKDKYLGTVGRIGIRVYNHNGDLIDHKECNNIVTYSATNLIAKAMTGDSGAQISHIRLGGTLTSGYSASNKFANQVTARSDTDMYYSGNPNPGNDTVVTVPAMFQNFESDETAALVPVQQTENAIVYKGTLGASVGNGYTFDEIGLFANSDTVLFAHAKIDPISKTSAFSIDYDWTVVFR